jgi:hypothetical protein
MSNPDGLVTTNQTCTQDVIRSQKDLIVVHRQSILRSFQQFNADSETQLKSASSNTPIPGPQPSYLRLLLSLQDPNLHELKACFESVKLALSFV